MNFKTKTSSLANIPKWNPYTTNAKSLTKTCYEPITKITANMKAQRMESRRYQRTNLIDNQRFLHDNDQTVLHTKVATAVYFHSDLNI